MAPGLTGFKYENPSFKLYSADSEFFHVQNAFTYRLDL